MVSLQLTMTFLLLKFKHISTEEQAQLLSDMCANNLFVLMPKVLPDSADSLCFILWKLSPNRPVGAVSSLAATGRQGSLDLQPQGAKNKVL